MEHHCQPLMPSLTRRRVLQGTLRSIAGLAAWQQDWLWPSTAAAQQRAPRGQMTWAFHFTLVPTFFDPAATSAMALPYAFLYALHDALVKPMP